MAKHRKNNKKNEDEEHPKTHPDLKGFYVKINAFGEIECSHSIDEINQFLNKNIVDKKLKHRFGYKSDADDDTINFMYGNIGL
ncbi:MAG: hypothetical protein OHK0057_11080 [Thermoflexibacter sp.]